MSVGLFVGTFDPFTLGHLEVATKALSLCDKLIIGIGNNKNKIRTFEKEKMLNCIATIFDKEIKRGKIEVKSYSCLTGDLAKSIKADFFVRGLRNSKDYEYEEELAKLNKHLFNIDTIYIRADKYPLVSSTLVKELLKANKNIKEYVPNIIYDAIVKKEN